MITFFFTSCKLLHQTHVQIIRPTFRFPELFLSTYPDSYLDPLLCTRYLHPRVRMVKWLPPPSWLQEEAHLCTHVEMPTHFCRGLGSLLIVKLSLYSPPCEPLFIQGQIDYFSFFFFFSGWNDILPQYIQFNSYTGALQPSQSITEDDSTLYFMLRGWGPCM